MDNKLNWKREEMRGTLKQSKVRGDMCLVQDGREARIETSGQICNVFC